MKKIYLLVVAAMAFAGCEKDMPAAGTSQEAGRVVDMVIPGDFDWKTVSKVSCDFSAPHASKIQIASVEGAEPFASFIVGSDAEPVALTVPRMLRTLCVSYETVSGSWKSTTLPIAEVLSFRVPEDSRVYAGTRADAPVGEIVYPGDADWGTLMFEDLWPGYGDYDFNDLVVNYSIKEFLRSDNKVEKIAVSLQVKAVGGSLPYDFYISLPGIYGNEIDRVEIDSYSNAADEIILTSNTDAPQNAAVVRVQGLRGNTKKPSGAIYVNTEPGYEMTESNLVRVHFYIVLREPIAPRYLTFDILDFYIGRTDDQGRKVEIHMPGYKPSADALQDYDRIREGNLNIGKSLRPYYSNNNLVWGLNVPADVKHAYERVDFLEAYPKFKEWAQSGGFLAQDWYLQGTSGKLVRK